jgi:hypothetical protein
MAILDRFRTQARHKHPDAAVRLAFVQELPLEERELLGEIAREDTDPRVRRSAVAKLMDPTALAQVARGDAEAQVRTQAVDMLRDIALEAFEGIAEADSHAAIDALDDMKTIAGIAKNASREATALRALARVSDPHALGSIARHAEHEAVRVHAFESLQDHGEILSVALNSEFRDPTVAAVEKITDRGELEQVATRAKNKSAAKRARAMAREIDDRLAAEEAAGAAAAQAERAARETEHAARIAAEKAAADEAVRAAAAATAQAEADARARDDAERRRLEEEAAARQREEQAAAEQARAEEAAQQAQKRAARLAELVEDAVKAAALDDVAAARKQFAVVRKEWNAVAAGGPADPAVALRYAEIDAAFSARDVAARAAEDRAKHDSLVRLQHLASRIDALAARSDLSLKAGERALKELRTTLGAMPQLPSKKDYEEAMRRLKAAQTALIPKVQELRDVADWQRWANVGIQEQLCEKMEALKALDDPEEIARQVRDLQQQWRQAADVPRAQGEALWKRFKAAHDEAWAKCEAHFAEQAGVRAENLAKKLALCQHAEALADSTNWIRTAEEIKKLQADWKTIGPVTRGQEKAVWERFRAACDRFFTRRHADLAERKTVWAENLGKKDALIAKAESLQDSTEWEAAAAEIKRLQAEWKAIGPVKKSRSEALWQRFRAACDHFFARYAQRHDIAKGERVAAREAIVAELEGLAGVESRESGVGSQSGVASPTSGVESPTSGGESQPEVASAAAGVETQSAIETRQSAIQGSAEPPADLIQKVRALRGRWNTELAARGVDRDRAIVLDQRFAAAFAGVLARWPQAFAGTDLDPDANRKRMESLVVKMEELAKSLAGLASDAAGDAALSPTTRLAAMLKEALAANTIGGKADTDHRFRAAADDVRHAQANWSRIGPVPDDAKRTLTDRFQRAMRRISDASAAHARGAASIGSGGSGRLGR